VLDVGRRGGEEHGLARQQRGPGGGRHDAYDGRHVRRPHDDPPHGLAAEPTRVGGDRRDAVGPRAEARARDGGTAAHLPVAVRSPSKSSLAAAPSRTAVPAGTELPSAGLAIVTAGGVFGARTRMLVWAWPPSPPESVTAAVTVCSPTVSALVVTVAPVPRLPSWLDVHSIRLDSSPSSASRAWAAKVI